MRKQIATFVTLITLFSVGVWLPFKNHQHLQTKVFVSSQQQHAVLPASLEPLTAPLVSKPFITTFFAVSSRDGQSGSTGVPAPGATGQAEASSTPAADASSSSPSSSSASSSAAALSLSGSSAVSSAYSGAATGRNDPAATASALQCPPPRRLTHGLLRDLVISQESLRRKNTLYTNDITPDIIALFPAKDPLENVSYKSCALVGSSGCLLKTTFGSEIDSHEAVFRFNNAPVKGFEQHVGQKQTVRFGTMSSTEWLDLPADFHIYVGFQPRHFKWFINTRTNKAPTLLHVEPELVNVAWSHLERKGNWPTTGFVGIFTSLQLCDRVHLYGFTSGDSEDCKYHYFDDLKFPPKGGNHNWDAERAAIAEWARLGEVVYH